MGDTVTGLDTPDLREEVIDERECPSTPICDLYFLT